MSLLTVITPSKNHLEGLRGSAESLAAQSFKDWDHLVIDGASQDGTVEYCQNRPQTRIISEPDNSFEAAVCKGMKFVEGKYATFLFCFDTLVDPNWLRDAVDFLEKNPEYSMVSGTAGSPAYPYEAYPSGAKFNYFFFIAPWTVINETAFVVRTSVLREQLPYCESRNRNRDIWFTLWQNFFSQGYLVHLLPHQVIRNDTHHCSLLAEDVKSGGFSLKVADFFDNKRAMRRKLLRGKFHIEFKDSEKRKLPLAYSRFAFTLAVICYKLNLFFIKKVLRRKLPKANDYNLHLGKKCVDFAVRN